MWAKVGLTGDPGGGSPLSGFPRGPVRGRCRDSPRSPAGPGREPSCAQLRGLRGLAGHVSQKKCHLLTQMNLFTKQMNLFTLLLTKVRLVKALVFFNTHVWM